jgi:restriction endonuclease Mrr
MEEWRQREAERERAEAERKDRAAERERREAERRRREAERAQRLRSLDGLNSLSGKEFEKLVQSLFIRDGYTVIRRGRSGDEGIDLVIVAGTDRDVVQCKRWKSVVGPAVVREFYGALHHEHARHGYIVTTARFSDAARRWISTKPITLIDGYRLIQWLEGRFSPYRMVDGR